jgi:hypothetical protein
MSRSGLNIHGLLNMNANRFFKQKSLIQLYHEARWLPERIPDEDVPMTSLLNVIRIAQTKTITDSSTGKYFFTPDIS